MVSFTTLLAFSASALASPILQARQIAIPENWTWHIDGWTGSCSRSGCSYNFNVTVPQVEGQIAGIKAYCNGYENGWYRRGNTFSGCQILEGSNNGVAAKFSERTSDTDGSPDDIIISFLYGAYGDRPAYNFTGSAAVTYNAGVAPAQEYDVTPTAVFAVA